MKLSDFHIGQEFFAAAGFRWRSRIRGETSDYPNPGALRFDRRGAYGEFVHPYATKTDPRP